MTALRKCLVGITLMLFILSGCQRYVNNESKFGNRPDPDTTGAAKPTPTAAASANSITPSASPAPAAIEPEDVIFKCIHSTKGEILEMLGDDYEIVYTGAEASYEGYHYEAYGITIIFDFYEDDSTVSAIQLDQDTELLGVNAKMVFSQVQEALGKAPVYETYIVDLYQSRYDLFYKINDAIVLFSSFDREGSGLSISVLREFRRYVGDTYNDATDRTECYWHVDEITGDLTRIDLYGEMHQPMVVDKGFIEGRIASVSENLGNSRLEPCIVVAAEKDGIFTIYRSMAYKDFREYRTQDDQGISFTEIKAVECKIENSGGEERYIIEVTPLGDQGQVILLDSLNETNETWQMIVR